MSKRFSICIPTWEQHGAGLRHLDILLLTIEHQSFNDYEIVISDHSKNDDIYNLVSSINLPITYHRNTENYGNGVSNLNNALKFAKGELIKIMFQDDFFNRLDGLEILDRNFTDDTMWIMTGFTHTEDYKNFERSSIPRWSDSIYKGDNTLGCPSGLTFRNKNIEYFDEKLTMLMDTEYYCRLYYKFGNPKILPELITAIHLHPNQITSRYDGNINEEISYIVNKHTQIL